MGRSCLGFLNLVLIIGVLWYTGALKWLCLGLFVLLLIGTVATFVGAVTERRRSRRQAKRPVIHHPVFGPVVRDQWEGLLGFREFPHMRAFWHPDPEGTVGRLSAEHRQWVTNRSRHVAELSSVCRNFDVRAALQSLGVYEVSVAVPKRGEPTAAQSATYERFLDREETICRNVVDALLRYYRHVREAAPDWFEDDDYPECRTAEELAKWMEFDGIRIWRISSHGLCPISLGWDPAWDQEHKLSMTLYREQVVGIGSPGGGPELLLDDAKQLYSDPDAVWGLDQLNEAERATLEKLIDGLGPSEEEN